MGLDQHSAHSVAASGSADPQVSIVFTRHAEKPSDSGKPHGIDPDGVHDPHSLSVRGWMRAGALAGMFGMLPHARYPGVHRPSRIYATEPSHQAKSTREFDTAHPTAQALGVTLNSDYKHGQEDVLAHELQSLNSQSSDPQSPDPQSPDPQSPDPQSPDPQSPDPQSSEQGTLVVWHHGALPKLLSHFDIVNAADVPEVWPEDRFDLMWVLSKNPGSSAYVWSEVNQSLLDGDQP